MGEYVKDLKTLVNTLVDQGYKPCHDGDWTRPGCVPTPPTFLPEMFKYCGKPKPEEYKWNDAWVVKVDEARKNKELLKKKIQELTELVNRM